MTINVLLNYATVGISETGIADLKLILELGDNPKLDPAQRILGVVANASLMGILTSQFLLTLGVPSLAHVSNVPAVLEISENDWTLVNFLDENKRFNARAILQQLEASATTSGAIPSDDASADTTS